MAKNKIKRSLRAILDPHPSGDDVNVIWTYFDSSCAYCGKAIQRDSRHGHLDHAVSTALGGTNAIHSHVLACAHCNGDEKREESWESFLKKKCLATDVFEMRRRLILEWISREGASTIATDSETQILANAIVESALASFDKSVAEMRRLRRGT